MMRNEGNYIHNIAVRAGTKQGSLIPCNRARTMKPGDDFIACDVCKGFFVRTSLWRHKHHCQPSAGGRGRTVQARARAAMPATEGASAKLHRVLSSMTMDAVSLVCKTDKTIRRFGEGLCAKLGNQSKDLQNIRNRMRELGRLLEFLRKRRPEAQLKDFIVPQSFLELTSGVREVAGFCEADNTYETPSLALKFGQSLKCCAEQQLASNLQNGFDTSSTREFIELYEFQWTQKVARHALTTLQEAKWNRGDDNCMPVAADIQKIHTYLEAETERRTKDLKDHLSRETHKKLAEAVLTNVILFNRRRQGEASLMTVDAYRSATMADKTDHPEVTAALSAFERQLADSLCTIRHYLVAAIPASSCCRSS